MCGIIATIGDGEAGNELLSGLENLEYRGYDSAGIAVKNGNGLAIEKREGQIDELKQTLNGGLPSGNAGIGHTRWSTHGQPSDENAHPHTDCDGEVAVVHNGIIENYESLRSELVACGHRFTSDTDSEVVPHLIEQYMNEGSDPKEAFKRTIQRLEGSYALAVLVEGVEAVYATRKDSPLVLGIRDDSYYLASDIPAFLEFTDEVMYVEDGDILEVDPSSVDLRNVAEGTVSRPIETVDWDPRETGKDEYDHYMQKEIYTQPSSLRDTIVGRFDRDTGEISLDDLPDRPYADVGKVQFVAAGTSYHAARFGATLLEKAGVEADATRASEFEYNPNGHGEALVVAVTQSGETADTLNALRATNERSSVRTLAVTNVVGSTAAREADDALFIRAGPEIGVAATKTFTSQAVTLTLLSERLAEDVPGGSPVDDRQSLLSGLASIPEDIEHVLEESAVESIADEYVDSEAFFFIGRGIAHPIALEGALKYKEITYEHAEGFAAGQLKHGPLALVTADTPVFSVLTGEDDERTLKNAKEAESRGADVITLGPTNPEDVGVSHLDVPSTHPYVSGLLANAHLQLLSYHTAVELDRAIDKPRNLAKSVTVE